MRKHPAFCWKNFVPENWAEAFCDTAGSVSVHRFSHHFHNDEKGRYIRPPSLTQNAP